MHMHKPTGSHPLHWVVLFHGSLWSFPRVETDKNATQADLSNWPLYRSPLSLRPWTVSKYNLIPVFPGYTAHISSTAVGSAGAAGNVSKTQHRSMTISVCPPLFQM